MSTSRVKMMEVGGGMMLQWSLRQGDAGSVITGWKTGKGSGREMDRSRRFPLSSKHLPLLSSAHSRRSVVISVAGGINIAGEDDGDWR